jgi:hypothetical protein
MLCMLCMLCVLLLKILVAILSIAGMSRWVAARVVPLIPARGVRRALLAQTSALLQVRRCLGFVETLFRFCLGFV